MKLWKLKKGNLSINERNPTKELITRSNATKVSFLQMGMAGKNAFHY